MREVCGAVTGAALVLGMRGGPDKNAVYPKVQEFCAKFREECGSVVCRELLAGTGATSGGAAEARTAEYYKKRPCPELAWRAAHILDQMLSDFSCRQAEEVLVEWDAHSQWEEIYILQKV